MCPPCAPVTLDNAGNEMADKPTTRMWVLDAVVVVVVAVVAVAAAVVAFAQLDAARVAAAVVEDLCCWRRTMTTTPSARTPTAMARERCRPWRGTGRGEGEVDEREGVAGGADG